VDSTANLTVEAGNFCPPTQSRADSLKLGMFVDFYRRLDYDAVALASRELAFGFDIWRNAVHDGLPVLAANVFSDKKAKKPLFKMKQANGRKDNGQYVIRKDHGEKLGVIGFVSASAWRARPDTSAPVTFRPPSEMGDLVRKIARKCDHLTVLGDFTLPEADSLASRMPDIDLIIGSNIRIDQTSKQGKTVIIGLPPRGNNGNYLEWNMAAKDSNLYISKLVSLDTGAPEDSTIAHLLADVKVQMTGPPPVPGAQINEQTSKPAPKQAVSKPAPVKAVVTPSAPSAPVTPPTPEEPDGTHQ
jgi:hypothetical protein